MDIHAPRRPLRAGLPLIIHRNPMGPHVARAAEKRTGVNGNRVSARRRELGGIRASMSDLLQMGVCHLYVYILKGCVTY